jgi:hypothetical protein
MCVDEFKFPLGERALRPISRSALADPFSRSSHLLLIFASPIAPTVAMERGWPQQGGAMQVLIVTFRLEGLAEAEYYRGCDRDAPAFTDIPGMIAKVWIADPTTNTYGGVYTFRDRESLEAYLASDLFRAIQEAPEFASVTAKTFAVLGGPTRVTHGAAVQAV